MTTVDHPAARPFRTAALGVLTAGLVLTQQACSTDTRAGTPAGTPAAPPPSAAPPSATSAPAPAPITPADSDPADGGGSQGEILDGERQIVLKPVPGFESVLAVDDKGRLTLTDGPGVISLFVLTRVGDRHQIRTAKDDGTGERPCMGLKSNGSNPLTVVAAVCDTSATGQLFRITPQDREVDGLPTYAIAAEGGAFLQISEQRGLIAEELGDSELRTTFSFVDNGPTPPPPTG